MCRYRARAVTAAAMAHTRGTEQSIELSDRFEVARTSTAVAGRHLPVVMDYAAWKEDGIVRRYHRQHLAAMALERIERDCIVDSIGKVPRAALGHRRVFAERD